MRGGAAGAASAFALAGTVRPGCAWSGVVDSGADGSVSPPSGRLVHVLPTLGGDPVLNPRRSCACPVNP